MRSNPVPDFNIYVYREADGWRLYSPGAGWARDPDLRVAMAAMGTMINDAQTFRETLRSPSAEGASQGLKQL